MKIRIRVLDPSTVTVHCTPSWLERLLGRDETDERAIYAGHGLWISDRTDRRIRSRRVLEAIERAFASN